MRGLLIKDLCVLNRQMRFFVIMMILFAVTGEHFLQGFALMYCGLFPLTLLTFDEQVRWRQYEVMLPYKTRDIVMSKYLIGICAAAIEAVLAVTAVLIRILITKGNLSEFPERVWIIGVVLCTAVLMMNIYMPMVYKWGVEKGRFLYILISIGSAMAIVSLLDNADFLMLVDTQITLAGFALAAVVTLPVSINLSEKSYLSKLI